MAPTPAASATPATPSATPPATSDFAIYGLPQVDELFRGAAIAALASGRAGILVVGNDRATGALESWTSATGEEWVRHWLPGSTFGGGTPDRLVGGSFGYLALGWRLDGVAFGRAAWSSVDGVIWRLASMTGLPEGTISGLVAGPIGTVATVDRGNATTAIAWSGDGQTWRQAAFPSGISISDNGVVALPDGFLVFASAAVPDSAGGATTIFTTWRSSDGLTWMADAALGDQIAHRENSIDYWQLGPSGAVGASCCDIVKVGSSGLEPLPVPPDPWGRLVGGPAGLLWFQGADRAATCAAVWRFEAGDWRPILGGLNVRPCIEAAGPFVLASASMADGMVILAQLGESGDRVAWLVRRSDAPPTGTVSGGAVETPPAEAIPDPLAARVERPASCPSKPTTVQAVLDLPPLTAVGCFGHETLSFRAWVIDPGDGYGGTCGAFRPMWIRECGLPDYQLAPRSSNTDETNPRLHVMRAPSATGDVKGVGRWVRVKGHYNDPVAPTCRGGGEEGGDVGLEIEMPTAMAVLQCRQVFVVTDIRTVS